MCQDKVNKALSLAHKWVNFAPEYLTFGRVLNDVMVALGLTNNEVKIAMRIDDAVKEYLGYKVPLNKLVLLVNREFKSDKLETIADDNLEILTDDRNREFINTEHGRVLVKRNDYAKEPLIYETTTEVYIDTERNKLKYK